MVGYFRPFITELSKSDRMQYKGLYCTFCRVLRERYGIAATFLNRYDVLFLLIYCQHKGTLSLSASSQNQSCAVVPLRKVPSCNINQEKLISVVDFAVFISYVMYLDKTIDKDENSIKTACIQKVLGPTFLKCLAHMKNNRNVSLDNILDEVKEAFLTEGNYELSYEKRVEYFCGLYVQIAGVMLPLGDVTYMDKQLLFHMLKIMYYLDSLEDYEEDLISGNFNLFENKEYNLEQVKKMAEYKVLKSIAALKNNIIEYQVNNILSNVLDIALPRKMLLLFNQLYRSDTKYERLLRNIKCSEGCFPRGDKKKFSKSS